VYFESQEYLHAGTRLYLLIDEPGSEDNVPTQEKHYLATVRWCHKLQDPLEGIYGIGAMFVRNECEWCGEIVPYEQLYYTESKTLLCARCVHDLGEIEAGRLKLSMTNKLIGNII
jgi:hypothetical protein